MFKTSRVRRTIIVILLVLLAFLAADLIARKYLDATYPGNPERIEEYLSQDPPAYAHSPYYSPEFLNEFLKDDSDGFAEEDYSTGLMVARTLSGKWFNQENGVRRTTDQPLHFLHTVWLFGTSAMQDLYVPDAYTIASQLQRLMPTYRVVNLGIYVSSVEYQYLRMKTLPIAPGDDIVFFNGADATGVYAVAVQERKAELPFPCRWGLYLTDALCNTRVAFPDYQQQAAVSVTDGIKEYVLKSEQYAHEKGADFYIFLEPMPFTIPLSQTEQNLPRIMPFKDPFILAYSKFRTIPGIIDISHALDKARLHGMETYLDYIHMTDPGDKLVAQAIALYLKPF